MQPAFQNIIEIINEDITKLNVDAIVNAANTKLTGGGGVDGAIHKAAGPELLQACMKLNGCNTGDSKITPGFNLPAKFIIHTVGPVWRCGRSNESELLKSCYITSLDLAVKNNIKTIAFPNISTGIYGFPKQKAAETAISTVVEFLKTNNVITRVLFVCFDSENHSIYEKILN